MATRPTDGKPQVSQEQLYRTHIERQVRRGTLTEAEAKKLRGKNDARLRQLDKEPVAGRDQPQPSEFTTRFVTEQTAAIKNGDVGVTYKNKKGKTQLTVEGQRVAIMYQDATAQAQRVVRRDTVKSGKLTGMTQQLQKAWEQAKKDNVLTAAERRGLTAKAAKLKTEAGRLAIANQSTRRQHPAAVQLDRGETAIESLRRQRAEYFNMEPSERRELDAQLEAQGRRSHVSTKELNQLNALYLKAIKDPKKAGKLDAMVTRLAADYHLNDVPAVAPVPSNSSSTRASRVTTG